VKAPTFFALLVGLAAFEIARKEQEELLERPSAPEHRGGLTK